MLVLISTYLTYLTFPPYLSLPLLGLGLDQTLYRKLHFSDGAPILVACRQLSSQSSRTMHEPCTASWQFLAVLCTAKLWQSQR